MGGCEEEGVLPFSVRHFIRLGYLQSQVFQYILTFYKTSNSCHQTASSNSNRWGASLLLDIPWLVDINGREVRLYPKRNNEGGVDGVGVEGTGMRRGRGSFDWNAKTKWMDWWTDEQRKIKLSILWVLKWCLSTEKSRPHMFYDELRTGLSYEGCTKKQVRCLLC